MLIPLAAAVLIGFAATPSPAQEATGGTRKAYDYALRCFVAGGVAVPKPKDDPSGERTKAIRERAHKAFDTVYVLGRKLKYSEAKISADLDRAQAVEMRLLVGSAAYFERSKADCIKLGLM